MIKTDVIERLHKLAEKATEEDAKELNAIANDVTMCMFSIDQFTVRLSSMIETPDEPKEEEQPKDLGPLVYDRLSVRSLNQVKALLNMDEMYYYQMHVSKEQMRKLKDLDFYTELRVGHFDGLSRWAFLRLRNCGKKTLNEIEGLMNDYGFHLSR